MNSVMGKENYSCTQQQDCPRAKKSKTDDDDVVSRSTTSCWECLPAVLLDDIFQYLSFKDTINASSTCHNWRQSLYHPRKWQDVNFVIEPNDVPKAHYLRTRAGHIVSNANVRFNSIEPACVTEFLLLLKCFTCNNNLKSLAIEPSHSTIEIPENLIHNFDEFPLYKTFVDIYSQHTLTTLSLGCNEELFEYLPDLLELIDYKKAEKVDTLALATVKEDPCNYLMQSINTKQLIAFRGLQILSLDYDNLNDEVLDVLKHLDDFRRLVVHVHGIWDKHPGTSEDAWLQFRKRYPNCLLRLSCIHSIDEVRHLHTKVLRNNMPLSHLKVLFCERMNLNVLVQLSMYRETLVSLMWVDNFSNVDNETFLKDPEALDTNDDIQPQELVIIAWLCKKLEEIVFIGYKFYEDDWVGITKLRAETLRRLEIASSDLILSGHNVLAKDVTYMLGKGWSPVPDTALHASIVDPSATDTDEYLMPILLADLK